MIKRVFKLLQEDNRRVGVANYWGLIIVGSCFLLGSLLDSHQTFMAFSLWLRGSSLTTEIPSAKAGVNVPILDLLEIFMIAFILGVVLLTIGLVSHRLRGKL